jgi:predicted Zn-dependent protease
LKFWKRAAIIEVNLTIHNLKIYDGSSNGYSNEVMLNSATKLVEDLNTSYRNTTEPKRGQVVITKFKVEGEVEVVKDLTQIETSGRNQTSLIYIADQKVVNQFSHTKLGDNANGATPSGTNLIVLTPYSAHLSGKNSNYTVSHEMGHALGLDHKLGDVKNLMYPYANPLRGVSLSFRQSKQLATTAINLDYSKHLKNLQKNENK